MTKLRVLFREKFQLYRRLLILIDKWTELPTEKKKQIEKPLEKLLRKEDEVGARDLIASVTE